MNKNQELEEFVLHILSTTGAVLTNGHFVYTSGLHGDAYVNKDRIYPHTSAVRQLCELLAQYFRREGVTYDVVVGPALGGIILSQWTAYFSPFGSEGTEVLAVYAEKDGKQFLLGRGYDEFVQGKRVLVVEDVVTTGGSARKVAELVTELGGTVVAIGALCNRGGVTAEELGVPLFFALINFTLETWSEQECPLCKEEAPINTDVGKGREFLARKARE